MKLIILRLAIRLTILAAIAAIAPFMALGIAVNLRGDYNFSPHTAMFWGDFISCLTALILASRLAR